MIAETVVEFGDDPLCLQRPVVATGLDEFGRSALGTFPFGQIGRKREDPVFDQPGDGVPGVADLSALSMMTSQTA